MVYGTVKNDAHGKVSSRAFFVVLAAAFAAVLLVSCSTPQERSGYNLKPFNSPAEWEYRPYGNMYQN